MHASNWKAMVTTVAVLLSVTAARCSDGSVKSSGTDNTTSSATAQSDDDDASDDKLEPNPTDLPTYPNLVSGSQIDNKTSGRGGVYKGRTKDPYDKVVEWYRAKLTGAREYHSRYYVDTVGTKEDQFSLDKWNGHVIIGMESSKPGTMIILTEEPH
jgi:hypothetical protein